MSALKRVREVFVFLPLVMLYGCSSFMAEQANKEHILISTELNQPIVTFNDLTQHLSVNRLLLKKISIDKKRTEEQLLFDKLTSIDIDGISKDDDFEDIAIVVSDNDLPVNVLFNTQLSRYITQFDFMCIEPLYYEYFQKRYRLYDKAVTCDAAIPFRVISLYGEVLVIDVDPKLVRDIHVVFASKDDNIMSQYGHISLRLVICPEVNSSKEECDANLYEHLVLGYMAHIDELKIDAIKGVFGGYNAYLYANNFMDIYQKYTIREFRDIYSLPLVLTQKEREYMVKGLAEIHWSYAGDYQFINNNCSSLMQLALAATWQTFSEEPLLENLYWRPDSFFENLKETAISDATLLDDLKLAEQSGYYFASTEPVYIQAFNVVEKAMGTSPYKSLDDYVEVEPSTRFNLAKNNAEYVKKLQSDNYLLEAQLLIEELSLIRFESLMNAEMGYFFEQHGLVNINSYMKKELEPEAYQVFYKCIFSAIKSLVEPIKRNNGIPIKNKGNEYFASESCHSKNKANLFIQVHEQLKSMAPKEWQAVQYAMYLWLKTIENINNYKLLKGA